jgi:adenylosuccinate lyase
MDEATYIDELLKVLKNKSLKYKKTICIGRSHGIHAEPTTFGLKLASFFEEFKRNKKRLKSAIEEISTCAISGAVGTFANIDPKVESFVAKVPTAPEMAHVEISSIALFNLFLFLLNSS